MAKYAGVQFSVFLVDGFNLIASTSDAVSMEREGMTQETNPFGASSIQNTPINIEKGMLTVGAGFFDTATDALHTATGSAHGVLRQVIAAIEDNIIGKHFMGFAGAYDQKYNVIDKKDQLAMADVTYLVSGLVEEGIIVQHLNTYTVTWDTKTAGGGAAPHTPVDFTLDPENVPKDIASNSLANPSVVTMKSQHGSAIPHNLITGQKILFSGSNSTPSLNGVQTVTVITPTTFSVPVNVTIAGSAGSFILVNTNAGGSGYLQVTAYSGSTAFIDKIMHSPDDSTYSALVTFTDLGSTHTQARERIAVAGFVDRYLSNQGNLTGAGSVTAFAGFARN